MSQITSIFSTPMMVLDLPSNDAALERIASAAQAYHCRRADDDAAFAKRTGRSRISRPDLLADLTPQDRAYLLEPINAAVRQFIGAGLQDPAADERQLAVRGFARYYAPGGRIVPHTHFDADVVVSIYLQTGADGTGFPGAPASDLILIDPVLRGYPYRAPFHRIAVRAGMAVVFPSYVLHETDPSPGQRVIAGLEYKVISHDMEKVFNPIESYC
ncbi:MAG: hypothetical protein WBI20_02615 [Burkholderiaceae bacterium]